MELDQSDPLVKGFDAEAFVAIMRDRFEAKTDEEIARMVGVSRRTVERWRTKDRRPYDKQVAKIRLLLTDEQFLQVYPR